MGWLERSHRALDKLANSPGLRQVGKRRYRQRFVHNALHNNLFMGVYGSFEDALAGCPTSLPSGYDNEGSAAIAYTQQVLPSDYPAIHWLARSFEAGASRVLDLGGHLGIKYYAFERVIDYPQDLRWTVCDVPAVVARGRDLARQRAAEQHLHFTDDRREIAQHEVLFASGSLQYLPMTLPELLREVQALPARVVINFTPMHEQRSYFTVNSIGTAFCGYRVQAREAFVRQMCELGYVQRDDWFNADKSMDLPYEKGYGVKQYSGFCFDLPSDTRPA